MTDGTEPEFSRRFAISRLVKADEPVVATVDADGAERAALAERFGLVALDRLAATLRLERRAGTGLIIVSGAMSADIVQTCVVSLEPFAAHLDVPFGAAFAEADHDAGGAGPFGSGIVLEPADADRIEDDPEPIEGDAIDLGELVAQHLSLALDPYPRAPGARFDAVSLDEAPAAAPVPFAVLGRLRSPH